MLRRTSIGALALMASLLVTAGAQAFDETKYLDLKGQWNRVGAPRWANPKTAPLTAEYRAIFEANLADQAAGGQGMDPTASCLAPGMPRVMNAYEPMEIVVTAHTTHILMDHIHDWRRIFTDGRKWPAEIDPSFAGYSIGQWLDEDGDGRYDVLVVATRGFKGPRTYDSTGLPFHKDNQTLIKERIYVDRADPNILYDEITVIDNALTGPWTVKKKYTRDPGNKFPDWRETICVENNQHVLIGKEYYFLSADGLLMPAKKNQAPPDLRYFNLSKK